MFLEFSHFLMRPLHLYKRSTFVGQLVGPLVGYSICWLVRDAFVKIEKSVGISSSV